MSDQVMLNTALIAVGILIGCINLSLFVYVLIAIKRRGDEIWTAELEAVRSRANRLHNDLDQQLQANRDLATKNVDLATQVVELVEDKILKARSKR